MTSNQLAYQANLEQARSNLAREEETKRSNLAREAETHRANKVKEGIETANTVQKYLGGLGSFLKFW